MPPSHLFYEYQDEFHADSIFIQANKEKRGVIFKRAESYVKEYRDAEREKIRLARAARQEGNFYVDDEPKLVFVVRIKGYAALTAINTQNQSLTPYVVSTRLLLSPARSSSCSVCCRSTAVPSSA